MTTWEPQTYLRYADIRFRAGLDLMARIPKSEYSSMAAAYPPQPNGQTLFPFRRLFLVAQR